MPTDIFNAVLRCDASEFGECFETGVGGNTGRKAE